MAWNSTWRQLAILLLCGTCFGADQIILKNGDKITGSVVKKDAKALTFKSDVFGSITVPWEKVEALTAVKPLFVVLPGNETVLATLEPKNGQVEVATVDQRREASLSDLVAIRNNDEQVAYERLQNPSWMQLWAGRATLGWAGTRGNARTVTFTVDLNASRVTSSDKTEVHMNGIRASADVDRTSSTTAQAVRGGWSYTRNLATRLTWNGFNDYEYDRFQNLDLRYVAGGGLGVIIWKRERSRFDLVGGAAYNHESFSANAERDGFTRDSAEVYTGNEFTFKVSPLTSLYQTSRFFTNLSNTGEYRFNYDMGANTKLTRWLTWNASVSNRYLSNPVVGRLNNDFLYTTGFGATFSR
jgi:putative salt-induced outer membrane protein